MKIELVIKDECDETDQNSIYNLLSSFNMLFNRVLMEMVSENLCFSLIIVICLPGYTSNFPDFKLIEKYTVLLPDNNVTHSFQMMHPKGECSNFKCWESHLTVPNKAAIAYYYNIFRDKIAKKQNLTMMRTYWHWELETEAIHDIQTCFSKTRTIPIPKRDIPFINYNMHCEETITRFTLSNGTQDEFVHSIFRDMLENDEDKLDNFDKKGNFRRSAASHFGCALIITKKNEGLLLCIYCTSNTSLSLNFQNCSGGTNIIQKSYDPIKYSNLCQFQKRRYETDYYLIIENMTHPACEKENKAETWLYNIEGEKQHWLISNGTNMVYFRLVGQALAEIVCENFELQKCPPFINGWFYYYELGKLRSSLSYLKFYAEFYGTNTSILQFPNLPIYILNHEIIQTNQTKFECCSSLFIFYLVLFIISPVLLIISIVYRYIRIRRRIRGALFLH